MMIELTAEKMREVWQATRPDEHEWLDSFALEHWPELIAAVERIAAHHLEPCETCIACEQERDAAERRADELLAACEAAETRILQLLVDHRRPTLAPYPRSGVIYVGIGPEEDSTVRLLRTAISRAKAERTG